MSAKVSSFERVKIGDFNYVFFLVAWMDYATPLVEELGKQIEPFGADLGVKGLVVEAFKKRTMETFEEVRAKNWPEDFRKRIEDAQEPFMLIINKTFGEFNMTDIRGVSFGSPILKANLARFTRCSVGSLT